MTALSRQSTGIPQLDELLGGGLIPGTLTVVVGSTGIGKTQLGVQYARAGLTQEKRSGAIFDCTARGDSQSHAEYARRLFDWGLTRMDPDATLLLDRLFAADYPIADYLRIFQYQGKRVTRRDLDWDDWHGWQAELNTRLRVAIAFFYANFIRGTRRVVLDGIEPADNPGESIQFNLLEYVYHQILRKDPEWVARDLFREQFRQNEAGVLAHSYDPAQIGGMLLYTSHEMLLDDLIARKLDEGDVLSNANTLIYLGKVRLQDRVGRGLYVAKHRGSRCDERILPFEITNSGLKLG